MKIKKFIRNTYVTMAGVTVAQIPGNMPSLYGTVPVTPVNYFTLILYWFVLPLVVIVAIVIGIVKLVKKSKNNDKKDSQNRPT